ncbi:MAG TPA: putative urea ABC transporter substrate-binding protein [Verrucomicrobiae bacterium]|jgi:NitT/TauT family transport system substrate-binding protein
MKSWKTLTALLALAGAALLPLRAGAEDQKTYRYLWSHYTGWEPWQYISDSGIMKKWADKYGVKIEIDLINDYVTSINQYTSGAAVGCAMTIMDTLDMPAAGGIDSDVLVVGDYSDGNDGLVLFNGKSIQDVKGRQVLIVKDSVSSYLLSQALKTGGLHDADVTEVNTSDANIGATFASSGAHGATVTWNPILMQVRNLPKATLVFDSSKIPGEIQDLMVTRHDAPANVKKALVGAWYEAMAVMSGQGKQADEAVEAMAKFAGGTVPEFKAQLRTTRMFYTPKDGITFIESAVLEKTAKTVAGFCFDHGLLGQGAQSADFIGIQLPDGKIVGDAKNVKIHYTSEFVKAAAAGTL